MTSSQKIARAFEIAGYILLIPSGFATLCSTLLLAGAPLLTFLIYGIFIFGCVLLAGYVKHSRGTLNEKRVRSLWIWTVLFNAALSLPFFFYAWHFFQNLDSELADHGQMPGNFFFNLCVTFAYLTAIVLAIKAYKSEGIQQLS